jgi:hypothetical protein
MRRERITIPFLVDVCDVSRRYISVLCAGECDPTRGMMLRIARAISYTLQRPVEVGELFDLNLNLDASLIAR